MSRKRYRAWDGGCFPIPCRSISNDVPRQRSPVTLTLSERCLLKEVAIGPVLTSGAPALRSHIHQDVGEPTCLSFSTTGMYEGKPLIYTVGNEGHFLLHDDIAIPASRKLTLPDGHQNVLWSVNYSQIVREQVKCKKPDVFRMQKQNKPRNKNTNQTRQAETKQTPKHKHKPNTTRRKTSSKLSETLRFQDEILGALSTSSRRHSDSRK